MSRKLKDDNNVNIWERITTKGSIKNSCLEAKVTTTLFAKLLEATRLTTDKLLYCCSQLDCCNFNESNNCIHAPSIGTIGIISNFDDQQCQVNFPATSISRESNIAISNNGFYLYDMHGGYCMWNVPPSMYSTIKQNILRLHVTCICHILKTYMNCFSFVFV